jgi:hypothetical protein
MLDRVERVLVLVVTIAPPSLTRSRVCIAKRLECPTACNVEKLQCSPHSPSVQCEGELLVRAFLFQLPRSIMPFRSE